MAPTIYSKSLSQGQYPTVTGSSWVTGNTPTGRYVAQAGTDKVEFDDLVHDIGDNGFTMLVDASYTGDAGTWQTAMSLPTNSGYGIYLPRSDDKLYMASWGSGTSVTEWTGATSLQDAFGLFGLTKEGGSSTPKGYKNGILQTITSGGDNSNLADGTTGVDLFTNTSDEEGHVSIRSAVLFKAVLTASEIASLYRDPYQLLKPKSPMFYFISSGSGVTGALAETLANDTLAATAVVGYIGSVSETLADDTLAASGSIGVSGSVNETLANDTLAATAVIGYIGSLSETLADDTLTATAKLGYIGSVAETLADDTLAASGGVGTNGFVNETLQDDTLAASGLIGLTGFLAETLQDDTLASSGTVTGTGTATPPTFQRASVQNITIGL